MKLPVTIKSYNGLALNDASFEAYFPEATLFAQVGADISEQQRQEASPLYSAKMLRSRLLPVAVIMRGTFTDQITTLNRYFDVQDAELHKLIVTDTDSVDWYLYATTKEVPSTHLPEIVYTLYAPDPIWRTDTQAEDTWAVTASGQTNEITISGNLGANPIYEITPTGAHSPASGLTYEKFIPVYNPGSKVFSNYPFDLCGAAFATNALVGAGKMQADGDDLRVYVDGVEVDRWLAGINTANTKVWINLDLAAKKEATLATAIASSGAVATVSFSTAIDSWPSSGRFMIGSEIFTYTGKDNTLKQTSGVTRAAKGSSMAAHSAGDTVRNLEHDIMIKYGNAGLAAPVVDDTKKPIISLTGSTNTSWVYADFRDVAGERSGIWARSTESFLIYTADHGANADPASEMGISLKLTYHTAYQAYWSLYHPAGITGWNFANGEQYVTAYGGNANLDSSPDGSAWATEYTTPNTAQSTWVAWSDNRATLATGTAYYIRMGFGPGTGINNWKTEVADVTLTLASGGVPVTAIGAEISTYELDCTLTNNATGQTLALNFSMGLDETIQVDTEAHTVTYLKDNSNAFAALNPPPARNDWLKLAYGVNELEYTETGAAGLTIVTKYKERNN